MIFSMTGYAKATQETLHGSISLEIRSVNNRYLKVSIKAPEVYQKLESDIERTLRETLKRGTVQVQIGLTRDDGVQVPGVANPILFSQTPVEYEKAPPKLGDGTNSVLGKLLGLTDAEIARLKDSGVIG